MSREKTKNMSYEDLITLRLHTMGYGGEKLVETELQIRQIEAFEKATLANEKLSKRIYILNWVIGFFTIVSAALTFSLWINPNWQGLLKLLGVNQ